VWEFKQIKDLYLRNVAPPNLFIEFNTTRGAKRLPIRRTWKVFALCERFKTARLNGGVQTE